MKMSASPMEPRQQQGGMRYATPMGMPVNAMGVKLNISTRLIHHLISHSLNNVIGLLMEGSFIFWQAFFHERYKLVGFTESISNSIFPLSFNVAVSLNSSALGRLLLILVCLDYIMKTTSYVQKVHP